MQDHQVAILALMGFFVVSGILIAGVIGVYYFFAPQIVAYREYRTFKLKQKLLFRKLADTQLARELYEQELELKREKFKLEQEINQYLEER